MQMTLTNIYEHRFSPFVIVLLFFMVLLCSLPGHYEINDDIEIINILSGLDGFSPGVVTVYLSQSLSYILFYLYQAFPSIPWFGILIYFATFIGCSLILGVIIRSAVHDKVVLIIYFPLLFVFFGYCMLSLSFTSATLLLLFGVVLSLLELLVKEQIHLKNRSYVLFLGVLFILSFLLRWKLSLYFSILATPLLLFVKSIYIKRVVAFIILSFCILFFDRMLFNIETKDASFKNYSDYNTLRSQFHDTIFGGNHGRITENALQSVGWEASDYIIFHDYWMLYDTKLFNAISLNGFLESNDPKLTGVNSNKVFSAIQNGLKTEIDLNFIFICGLFVLIFYKLIYKKDLVSNYRFILLSFIAIIFSSLIYLMYYRYLPRIFLPIYCYALGVFALLTNAGSYSERGPYVKAVSFSIVAFLFIITIYHISLYGRIVVNTLDVHRRQMKHVDLVFDHIHNIRNRDTIIIQITPIIYGGINFQNINPLREKSLQYEHFRILPSGTSVNSLRYFKILNQLGLNNGRELLEWTVNNNNVIFVLFARGKEMVSELQGLWETYYDTHIASSELKVIYDFRNEHGTGLVIFSMVEKS